MALVKVTMFYSNGTLDVIYIPIKQITSTTVTVGGWVWSRASVIVPVRDPSTMSNIELSIKTFDISQNIYFDNLQVRAETGILGLLNISPRSITGDIIMDGTLDVKKLIAGQLVVGTNVAMGSGSVIDWNITSPPTAAQTGAKPVSWYPTLAELPFLDGFLTHIDEYGIYTGELSAQQVEGLLLKGVTIEAGTVIGINDNAVINIGTHGGSVDTQYDGVKQLGGRASIRLKPGTSYEGDTCGYIQILEDGSIYFYSSDGSGKEFAYIKPDGSTSLSFTKPTLAYATDITFRDDGTGFDTILDKVSDGWNWAKDEYGRITQMVSQSGRIVVINYPPMLG